MDRSVDYTGFQKEIFHKIVDMQYRMQNLAGIVQNDFKQLLDDGVITRDEIKNSITTTNREFTKAIHELEYFKNKVIEILKHYS